MRIFIIYLEYFVSTMIWGFLNPFGMRQMFTQTGGQVAAIARSLIQRGKPAEPPVSLRLPFEGWWKVHNGGVTRAVSHSWDAIAQRYAYDFLITDENNVTFHGDPSRPENYYVFGKPVLAAAGGEVVAVRADLRDHQRAGSGWIDWRTPDLRGNHIVIRHSQRQYSLYAHLQAGSVCVRPGEQVEAGQRIANCGHSGHSTEPHLHFQLQDRADFFTAVGLPAIFSGFERRKVTAESEYVRRGAAERGFQVRSAEGEQAGGLVEIAQQVKPTSGDLISSVVTLLFTLLGTGLLLFWIVRLILRLF
ncbi:MAG: M23 family metallopeptidase [Chloroflexota bacterium]|jgi:hypothetical protein